MTALAQLETIFAGLAAVLALASLVGFVLQRRYALAGPNATVENLNTRIKAWWLMVALNERWIVKKTILTETLTETLAVALTTVP